MHNGVLHVRKVRLLYKTILKLHRGLPEALQSLGDNYVKDEFKRHKKCNSAETAQFMMEWTHYAVVLANQLGLQEPKPTLEVGTDLDEKTLELMREDQVVQLYEMLQAAKGETTAT
ncbi:succinate dehydrogenase assembly factor 3, mitochondrial [Homalodisca vitripennis]|uniref:succinate dehydrogenase assembly factor 3, mitochondrial n=1 Tax=Homalodisca vitripennis TaxID=197043 RepID=UPI001EEAE122|nr:succinate dehydrogenase assembly factor 3, mitochondrial [Homalodisca vitripennis]XP_046682785.1 succinate dehydrogenase assembly factor 3, mitochondrial [Homalodisca vitripennis]XP_046682786.1 succinate dehydrogenase assembly factor 3, mitochondrial [Homalodisca vitripennis]KAG8242472.1 acetate non-utilizing protein 9 [Homalodisca vitripennis]